MGSKIYTLLSEGNYNTADPLSYSTCYVVDHKMYVMYGVKDDTSSPSNISIFDLVTH